MNTYAAVQIFGRTGRLGTVDFDSNRGPEVHLILSMKHFENQLRQVARTEDKKQRGAEKKLLFEMMKLFLFSTECINEKLKTMFSEPTEETEPDPSGNASPAHKNTAVDSEQSFDQTSWETSAGAPARRDQIRSKVAESY